MPIVRFLDPKSDYAFQQIFGLEKNKDILIGNFQVSRWQKIIAPKASEN